MNKEIAVEELRGMAKRADLQLPGDELERLLPGVNRACKQAAELREILSMKDEPAGAFDATTPRQK